MTMKHPLTALTIVFCCGIYFASFIRFPFWLSYVLEALFLICSFLFLKHKLSDIFIYCSVFVLGGALLCNTQVLHARHIARYASHINKITYVLKGVVDSDPESRNRRSSFVFKTEGIAVNGLARACLGKVLVRISTKSKLCYGEELILKGRLSRPFSRSYRTYLSNQGIFFIMYVQSDADVVRLKRNRGQAVKRFALRLKNKISCIFSKHLSALTASVLEAMVLGEKENVPAPLYKSMIRTGTVHILVVSGFNVGIVAFAVMLVLKLLRAPRKMRFLITAACLIVYCLMTGVSNPVVRATIMALLYMLAYFFKREPGIYNSLSVAVIFILALNPRQLFDIGFQLSFASVISIAYIYPKLKQLIHTEVTRLKPLGFIADGFLVSLSAWLGTMGFIAYYFKIFSPVTVLANIFIVPLASFMTLCGFSLLLAAIISPSIAAFFALTTELAAVILLKLNILLLGLPFACFRLP